MATRNEITGDEMRTKPGNTNHRNNFSKICWSKHHYAEPQYVGKHKCPECGEKWEYVVDKSSKT